MIIVLKYFECKSAQNTKYTSHSFYTKDILNSKTEVLRKVMLTRSLRIEANQAAHNATSNNKRKFNARPPVDGMIISVMKPFITHSTDIDDI